MAERIDPPEGTAESRSLDRYRRAGITAGSTIAARGIAIATAVATVPITLPHLGTERFGVWMTINSLAMLLVFADLGLGNSLMTAVARSVGSGHRMALARYVSSGTWMLALVGLGLALIATGASFVVDWASLLNVRDPLARSELAPAILVFGVCLGASLPVAAAAQVRLGHQEAYISNLFTAGGNLLGLGLILAAVDLDLGLPALVFAVMGAPLLAGLANALLLFFRQKPELAPVLANFERRSAIGLMQSGSQFFVLQLAVAGAFYADTVIAAIVIGPTAAAEFAVVNTVFLVPVGMVSAALSPLWPAYAEARARGDTEWIRSTLRRSLLLAAAISAACGVAIVLAWSVIADWLTRGEAAAPFSLVVAFAVWSVLRCTGTAIAMFLNGVHALRIQLVTAVLMAVLNVALSIWLAGAIGVVGVVIGSLLAYPMATLLPLAYYVPKIVRALESDATRIPAAEERHGS